MSSDTRWNIDIASYPEFDNLVAEVTFANGLTMVLSKEPGDVDYFVSFFGGPERSGVPSSSKPGDQSRIDLPVVLAALEDARLSLEG